MREQRAPRHPTTTGSYFYTLAPECADIPPQKHNLTSLEIITASHTRVRISPTAWVMQGELVGHQPDGGSLPPGYACSAFIRVLATSGDNRAIPTVIAHRSGYSVRVVLWHTPLSSWNLTVKLQWVRFDLAGWGWPSHERSSAGRDNSGCLRPSAWPVVSRFAISPPPVEDGTMDLAKNVSSASTADTAGSKQALCGREALSHVGLRGGAWHVAGCELPRATPQRVKSLLRGKWVLFVGQSTLSEVYFHTLTRARGSDGYENFQKLSSTTRSLTDPVFQAEARQCYGKTNFFGRDFDVLRSAQNGSKSQVLPEKVRLTNFWDGHEHACKNSQGISALVTTNASSGAASLTTRRGEWLRSMLQGGNSTPQWLRSMAATSRRGTQFARDQRLEDPENQQDDGATLGWSEGPDVVIFNSGLHDMQPGLNVSVYGDRLRALWSWMREWSMHAHFIWMSTGVVVNPRSLQGGNNRTDCPTDRSYSHPVPVVRLMNQLASQIAIDHGADILDQARLRELTPLAGDGMHGLGGALNEGTLALLTRLIELGPR